MIHSVQLIIGIFSILLISTACGKKGDETVKDKENSSVGNPQNPLDTRNLPNRDGNGTQIIDSPPPPLDPSNSNGNDVADSESDTVSESKENEPKFYHLDNMTTIKTLPKQSDFTDPGDYGSYMVDILTHVPPGVRVWEGDQSLGYDNYVSTKGHETLHGIHANLRNKLARPNQYYGAFYLYNGKYLTFPHPKITITQIASEVPSSLQGMSYKLYLIEQRSDWNDRPLYIMDEWVAYWADSVVTMERYDKKLLRETGRSAVDIHGTAEFMIYGIALLMAIEKNDPSYLQNTKDFKEFVGWLLEYCSIIRQRSLQTNDTVWMPKDTKKAYSAMIQNSAYRGFITKHYGQKFTDSVLK